MERHISLSEDVVLQATSIAEMQSTTLRLPISELVLQLVILWILLPIVG